MCDFTDSIQGWEILVLSKVCCCGVSVDDHASAKVHKIGTQVRSVGKQVSIGANAVGMSVRSVFYRLNLIEAYGTGMPKIMKAYAGSNLEPKIETTSNAFKITLPNRKASVKEAHMSVAPESNEGQILSFVASNGYIVRSDVDVLLNVSQATANRILKRMVSEGLLYQDGSGRRTRYKKK